MSAAKQGRSQPPEQIAKRMANMPKTKRWGPTSDKMRAHLAKARDAKGPTRPELAVRTLLDGFGVEFIEQHPIGVYTVDFFVPRIGLVIEADGAYWHADEAKERVRDAYLLRNPAVRDVVHLTEEQLRPWTPKERFSTEYRAAISAVECPSSM